MIDHSIDRLTARNYASEGTQLATDATPSNPLDAPFSCFNTTRALCTSVHEFLDDLFGHEPLPEPSDTEQAVSSAQLYQLRDHAHATLNYTEATIKRLRRCMSIVSKTK